ncbi:MAG: ornithine cyclodeaminase family protein [Arenimonas sp.]
MNGTTVSPMTLILSRNDVASLATPRDYLAAMESAFLSLAEGTCQSLPVGHVPTPDGGFHIKSALNKNEPHVVAIKINGNFPMNPSRSGLPTIQGCLMLASASDARLLALMDSIEITARRTAAATALAAKHLAKKSSKALAFVGCGAQARYHLEAMLALDDFAFTTLRLFDTNADRMAAFARDGEAAGLSVYPGRSVADAVRTADVVVMTTTSTDPIIHAHDVQPGTFIAAVGADSPSKSEVSAELMAKARVVPDILSQAAEMGDLRRAIAEGLMSPKNIHGELAQIVSGLTPGRQNDEDIFVFDSTGTAIEDVAAASMLYAIALNRGIGLSVPFNGITGSSDA